MKITTMRIMGGKCLWCTQNSLTLKQKSLTTEQKQEKKIKRKKEQNL